MDNNILESVPPKKRRIDGIEDDDELDESTEFKSTEFDPYAEEYNEEKRSKTKVSDRVCLLCECDWSETYSSFYKIMNDNIKDQELDSIFKLMHEYYEIEIKSKNESNTENLTPEDIKNHFLYCVHEPLIEYHTQISQYKSIRRMLYDSAIQANNNGERLYDFKVLDRIEKINSKILSLYKEKPAQALFASNKLNLQ